MAFKLAYRTIYTWNDQITRLEPLWHILCCMCGSYLKSDRWLQGCREPGWPESSSFSFFIHRLQYQATSGTGGLNSFFSLLSLFLSLTHIYINTHSLYRCSPHCDMGMWLVRESGITHPQRCRDTHPHKNHECKIWFLYVCLHKWTLAATISDSHDMIIPA